MVNIIIEDTGLVAQPYSASEPRFTNYGSATIDEKRAGEFRVENPLILKVTAINMGISNTNQTTLGINDIRAIRDRITTEPFQFSLTCMLKTPKSFNSLDLKDLNDLRQLLLMTLSKGHKDLYVYDGEYPLREALLSLFHLIYSFGTIDAGNTINSDHINIMIDSFSLNEGAGGNINFNINCTLIWDFRDF